MTTELEQIWSDDAFGRRAEAQKIENYLVSVASSKARQAEGRAFTLAIDAPYGVGKSFFLRRLSQQLATKFPTAYVDAWADDLMDEPLTALAATLKDALSPYLKEENVKRSWDAFLATTGRVAKVAAISAIKRGMGLVVGAEMASLVGDVVKDSRDAFKDAAKDLAKDAGKGVIEDSFEAGEGNTKSALMDERIEAFEAGKSAVEALKASLRNVLKSLPKRAEDPMIVIIVDELDRCRPPYAVKLLEEIKHLFDVPGLVFIFGMNEVQLSRSLASAYGANFDGQAYLRRFVGRYYRLPDPDLQPLLKELLARVNIEDDSLTDMSQMVSLQHRLLSPPILYQDGSVRLPELSRILAVYMNTWSLNARDALSIVDNLQTFLALSKGPILLPFLMPHLMQKVADKPDWDFKRPERRKSTVEPKLKYLKFDRGGWSVDGAGKPTGFDFIDLAIELRDIANWDRRTFFNNSAREKYISYLVEKIYTLLPRDAKELPTPLSTYHSLLETVGDFSEGAR